MKGITCVQILTNHKDVVSTSRTKKHASRKLNITWYNKHVEHIPQPCISRSDLGYNTELQRAHTQTEVQKIRSEQYP